MVSINVHGQVVGSLFSLRPQTKDGGYVLLLSNPLLGGIHATGAAAFSFTTVVQVFGVRTVGRSATIPANAMAPLPQASIRLMTSLVHSETV